MLILYSPLSHIAYDGSQLRSGWLRETFSLPGDALAAFVGSCDVQPDYMIDLEDLQAGHLIRARCMLHFIIEHFNIDLDLIVARQRILAALVREILHTQYAVSELTRQGDDLYVGSRKLSISVATVSAVSGLIHFALNIDPTGAPVAAIGLRELSIEPEPLAKAVSHAYAAEIASCEKAAQKVRPAP